MVADVSKRGTRNHKRRHTSKEPRQSKTGRTLEENIESGSGGYRVWVAKQGERVVGYCLAKMGEHENYLEALYILASHQGKGVAQQLMDEAMRWLGTTKPIGLGVASYNTRAIAFYKKYGFHESDELPEAMPPLPSGKILPIQKMVKPIGAAHRMRREGECTLKGVRE